MAWTYVEDGRGWTGEGIFEDKKVARRRWGKPRATWREKAKFAIEERVFI